MRYGQKSGTVMSPQEYFNLQLKYTSCTCNNTNDVPVLRFKFWGIDLNSDIDEKFLKMHTQSC